MTNTTTTTIRCGACKGTHETVEQVKACHKIAPAVARAAAGLPSPKWAKDAAALPAKPMALTTEVPASRYALRDLPGSASTVTFFDVHYGKKGTKWDGFLFLTRLVGHPGSFAEYPVKGAAKAIILQKIAEDPKAAAFTFADEFKCCARCLSPLTDDTSRAMGLGPTCREAF